MVCPTFRVGQRKPRAAMRSPTPWLLKSPAMTMGPAMPAASGRRRSAPVCRDAYGADVGARVDSYKCEWFLHVGDSTLEVENPDEDRNSHEP